MKWGMTPVGLATAIMLTPVRRPVVAWCLIVGLLAGCSSNEPAQPSKPSQSSSALAGAQSNTLAKPTTIEDVWAQMGCVQAQQILPNSSDAPPGTRTGICRLHQQLAFFYEFPSAELATQSLKSGKPQVGPQDAVYLAGSVVIVASDAATAKDLAAMYPPYTP